MNVLFPDFFLCMFVIFILEGYLFFCFHLNGANLLYMLVKFRYFVMDSLKFFMHMIVSPARNILFSSFFVCSPYCSIICLLAVATMLNTVLKRCRHLCIILDFNKNIFYLISNILVMGLMYIAFIMFRNVTCSQRSSELFSWNSVGFCQITLLYLIRCSFALYTWVYLHSYWLAYVEMKLHLYDETNTIMVMFMIKFWDVLSLAI